MLDTYEKDEKKLEIMFEFNNVWNSFEQKINLGIKEMIGTIITAQAEHEKLKEIIEKDTLEIQKSLDIFLEKKAEVKKEVDEVRCIVDTINSIEDKNITFVEADIEYIVKSVAKLLEEKTKNGFSALREELSEKFKDTYVSSRMIDQQLKVANKGLESVLDSCKRGNTSIATSEVLMNNLMQIIRFTETLSENQKEKLITFDKSKSQNLAIVETNAIKVERLEDDMKDFKIKTDAKLDLIIDILQKQKNSMLENK